jgi:hypothetical protein
LVANASVQIQNLNTNLKLNMLTNADGIAHFENIPEGRYQLTVQKLQHGSFRSVLVVEGEGINATVFIPRQVVSYTWSVVPTGNF